MFCIQCGVELADSEKRCPLCGTVVYHPDLQQKDDPPPYPNRYPKKENPTRGGIMFILTSLFVLPIGLTLFIDLRLNHAMTWAGYPAFSLILVYIWLILPLWFKRPNPVILVPIDFAAVGLFLVYINWATDGDWFLSLALPVVGFYTLYVTTLVTLMRYVPRGVLYIWSGAWMAQGGFFLLLEMFINITFDLRSSLLWSPYPAAAFIFIGFFLLVVAICRPIREELKKRFFV